MSHQTIQLPAQLKREFMAALQAVRPGSVEEELTETVCISLLRDRLNPNSKARVSIGGTGRPGTAESQGIGEAGVSENEWKLMQRAKSLEDELRLALCAAEDIRALKAKASSLMEEVRSTKEQVTAQTIKTKKASKDKSMLTDHAEKLMKIIRQMHIDKLKLEEKRHEERQLIFKLTQDIARKDGKLESKRKLLNNMQSVVSRMERQLELMDQKFIDLRMRFDAAKSAQNGIIDKATKESANLRKKFAFMTRGKGRLDDVPLLSESPVLAPNSVTILHPGEQFMDAASTGYFPSPKNGKNNNQTDYQSNHARPATTGGIGRSSSGKRPGSAGPRGAAGATGRKSPTQASHTANPEHDIDKIIEKIYAKQKLKEDGKWTPSKLRSLVSDSAGRVGCAIPDITSHLSPKKSEPIYSKLANV